MTELQKRAFDCQKQNSGNDVNTEFNAEKGRRGGKVDVVICAELANPVDDEFLNQVGAVGDAGDERGAGDSDSTEREPRAHRANEKCGHASSDERELPDARSNGEVFGLAQIQCISDQPERCGAKARARS